MARKMVVTATAQGRGREKGGGKGILFEKTNIHKKSIQGSGHGEKGVAQQ